MDRNEYENKRAELMSDAQASIDGGDEKKSAQLIGEIKELDNKFSSSVKEEEQGLLIPENATVEIKNEEVTTMTKMIENVTNLSYVDVWADAMMGIDLSNEARAVFVENNETFKNVENFTTSVSNTPSLVPQTVVDGIYAIVGEEHAFFNDVRKYNVRGELVIDRHKEIKEGDAAFYDEAVDTTEEENEFDQFKISGHELAKAITVKWKMLQMSREDFVNFITEELASRVSDALGTSVVIGTGVKQPEGVVVGVTKVADQVIKYGNLAYTDVTTGLSKIKSKFAKGAAIYVNNTTLWGVLANVLDNTGRPFFVPDPTGTVSGFVLGLPVKEEGGLKDGDIMIGNAYKGYSFNTQEKLSVTPQDDILKRKKTFGAYAIVDGKVFDETAFCLLTHDETLESQAAPKGK